MLRHFFDVPTGRSDAAALATVRRRLAELDPGTRGPGAAHRRHVLGAPGSRAASRRAEHEKRATFEAVAHVLTALTTGRRW